MWQSVELVNLILDREFTESEFLLIKEEAKLQLIHHKTHQSSFLDFCKLSLQVILQRKTQKTHQITVKEVTGQA